MINKYLLSKLLFGLFSTTTVVIFVSLYLGTFVDFIGSIENAAIVYATNTSFLLISLLWYIWEKAHKDTRKHKEREILEVFAKHEATDARIKSKIKN